MDASSFLSHFESFPKRIQKQILAFAESIISKNNQKKEKKRFDFHWENGLAELSKKYTSVELQHKAKEWR